MEPVVIYEDEYVLVLNKPSGLVVHGDGRTNEETLVDWILEHYPETEGVGEPLVLANGTVVDRPGVVHRLDRETSGVIVIAKTQESFLNLKEQFKNRKVEKIYNAFVYGHFPSTDVQGGKEKEGIINRPIGRSASDFRKWSAQRGARGELREAITEYKVLKEEVAEEQKISFLEIKPKTGRTHQIRVHMKAINHPVICDKLYAPKSLCLLGFDRLALHARNISFLTLKGDISAEADLPEDFVRALNVLEK